MKRRDREQKPLPLALICLIALLAVIAWCATHPENGQAPAWPVKGERRT
ncbi:hypothetical protein [Burkholderia ambifaria]|jgi:hypothetical protein|nr:hypothetical protein [Burkholderia ambifaria]